MSHSLYCPAITVYGASSASLDPVFYEAARRVGAEAGRRGIAVVNGGGRAGLMGAVTDGCLEAGGMAIGVIPRFMVERGWQHPALSCIEITETMHQRKQLMADLATGIIALPGGIGTMDELMEIITWRQLGLFKGNIVIFNTDGYWDDLLAMLDTASRRHFMRTVGPDSLWTVTDDPAEAVRIASTPVEHNNER